MSSTIFLSLVLAITLPTPSADGQAHPVLDTKVVQGNINFFAIGDWGGTDDTAAKTVKPQVDCAAQFNRLGPYLEPKFFVSTGDNIYPEGVQSPHSDRFRLTFDQVFTYGKEESIPWYLVPGNHDHDGNIRAQVEYSWINTRWVMPDQFYSVMYTNGLINVKMIFIDTVVLCGNTPEKDKTQDRQIDPKTGQKVKRSEAEELPVGLRTKKEKATAQRALEWINGQLADASSSAHYIFVVGHYPIYSFNSYVDRCLHRLEEMLVHYRVTAYLCGHEHNLQHTKVHGVHHILTGGGHLLRPNYDSSKHDGSKYQENYFYPAEKMDKTTAKLLGGFAYISLQGSEGYVTYYRSDGAEGATYRMDARG